MGAWNIFTTFLFAMSITPWQIHLTCTNGATLGHVVTGCGTLLREKSYNYRHDYMLLNLGRILESVKSMDR